MKTKKERLGLVWDWLCSEFPVRRKCSLHILRGTDDLQGWVVEEDGEVDIFIDSRLRYYTMVETLLHEFAHVKSRRVSHCMRFREWEHKIEERYWKWRKK